VGRNNPVFLNPTLGPLPFLKEAGSGLNEEYRHEGQATCQRDESRNVCPLNEVEANKRSGERSKSGAKRVHGHVVGNLFRWREFSNPETEHDLSAASRKTKESASYEKRKHLIGEEVKQGRYDKDAVNDVAKPEKADVIEEPPPEKSGEKTRQRGNDSGYQADRFDIKLQAMHRIGEVVDTKSGGGENPDAKDHGSDEQPDKYFVVSCHMDRF
jgi:hypothetical protein